LLRFQDIAYAKNHSVFLAVSLQSEAKTSGKNAGTRFSVALGTTCGGSADLEREKGEATKIVTYPLL